MAHSGVEKDIYGKRRSQEDVAIQFSDRDDTYYLPRKELMKSFDYFQKALGTDEGVPRWQEGISNSCRPDVTSKDFGWIWRWIQLDAIVKDVDDAAGNGTYYLDELDVWNKCDAVKDALDAIVAADHLLLVDKFKGPFTNNMACIVGLLLERDRRNLTAADIEFVQAHRVFTTGETCEFLSGFGQLEWDLFEHNSCQIFLYIFAISAVRPFLQAGMASNQWAQIQRTAAEGGPVASNLPEAGHVNFEDWCAIIKHCQELMSGNLAFALTVMEAVSETLTMKHLDGTIDPKEQRYRDPLDLYLCHIHGNNPVVDDRVDPYFVI
ncbi:hypothetical protein DL546_006952 [Coniochaeta pulveracea]|uniref:Uncharacterized protein n=1 Tax=Coniochaeta pulveracea TaxID=177199 RepID=A0A420YDY1_9PEZI|nr:hypothetical protein DL546_006952 [Coniochaeta pulveracea]